MATDYDAPRKTEEDLSEDSLQELQARRSDKNSGVVDEDETEAAEGFELPGADLSGEELSVRVLPRQADEFTCSSCFLVHHRSQLAYERGLQPWDLAAGALVAQEAGAQVTGLRGQPAQEAMTVAGSAERVTELIGLLEALGADSDG